MGINMTEKNIKIIELINDNKSLREMCKELNITEKQLFVRLKQIINYGYQIEPKYYYGGDIRYDFIKQDNYCNKIHININMSSGNKIFRCIVVSDIHVGNVNSDIKLMYKVYNYASKNGIKTILNCGDNIEGDYTTDKLSLKNLYSQMDYFIKKYPYDKTIMNYVILGNHDYHSLKTDGLNLSQRIKNTRYDIVPIGYGKGVVNLKNDNILMLHKLNEEFNPKINEDINLILTGHGHMMKTKAYEKFNICVPSLSNVSPDKTKEVIPGFIDLNITFENGKIEFVEAKHMIVSSNICQVSESRCRVKKYSK